MTKKLTSLYGVLLAVVLALPVFAAPQASELPAGEGHPALKDAVILIIRHAEKPEAGFELSPTGQARAEAYIRYFKNFTLDSKPFTLDYLFATADSKGSHRPRLTLEPLSKNLGLKLDTPFKTKNPQAFAQELQSHNHGQHILIAWHHGEIPELVKSLGANPAALLPGGKWPAEEFGWIILLRYDHAGRLLSEKTTLLHEKLMPGDD